MFDNQIILWAIKLILGGISSFLAILLWSKSRSFCWICLITAVLISYAGIIYEMMIKLGIFSSSKLICFGLPIITLCFTIIPHILFIISLILIIKEFS